MHKLDENVKSIPEADWLRKGVQTFIWNTAQNVEQQKQQQQYFIRVLLML